LKLAKAIGDGVGNETRVSVAVFPPFPYLAMVQNVLKDTPVAVGAQNLFPGEDGAFTGEVSTAMLQDVGCTSVILGHSERRHRLGESDDFINQKVRFALSNRLKVILCIGETLAQREANQTEAVLVGQLNRGLANVSKDDLASISLAYEPVWAIGNQEHHATPAQAEKSHSLIRGRYLELFGKIPADEVVIQYGGSVNPENASMFLSGDGIDGVLIGGASLNAQEFLSIIRAGLPTIKLNEGKTA
jgi:triosephosphate isomerase